MLKTKNITYLAILIILGLIIVLCLVYTGKFFADTINQSFQPDESKIDGNATTLDLATFKKIAPRLGLKL